jgi:hypothetical protein
MILASLLVLSQLTPQTRSLQSSSPYGAGVLALQKRGTFHDILRIGGAEIEVELRSDSGGLPAQDIRDWVRKGAVAVTTYYGQFPVQHARIIVTQTNEADRSVHGTTWGDIAGVQGLSKMRLGQEVTKADLDADWTMTHEMVHMAFSSLPEESHWLEEGLATYVEPIARAQAGQLSAEKVWEGMISGMPQGQPAWGDRGLDRTHTWGRTYWGGAMFCLMADVRIRQATHNRKGLQDALRAIVATGATIDTERPIDHVLEVGNKATGTTVLTDLYEKWKDNPVPVNLDGLWLALGVKLGSHGVEFDPDAPLSPIRNAILSRTAVASP